MRWPRGGGEISWDSRHVTIDSPATPIYNIPMGRGGHTYNIQFSPHTYPTDGSPLFTPPFSPLYLGGSPPVRIPSYI